MLNPIRNLLLSTSVLLLSVIPAQADYYVYKSKDGTSLYTDKQMPRNEYKLIATIGRPTASISCSSKKIASRAKDHQETINQYSKLYDVDADLIKSIIRAESCFDKRAVSRVGAKGLMQLMPQTAKQMGVYNVFNANDNIRGGTRYFRDMLKRFDYDVELALAAYNAGPHAVEKYKGIPPYKETQTYVKRVLKYYNNYSGIDS